MPMAVALVVAAGRGERLGASGPKALVEVAGRPMLDWSLDALRSSPAIERIVVALPEGVGLPSGGAPLDGPQVIVVAGGAERSHSVRRALAAAGACDVVLVHDAARPLLTAELVAGCLAALEEGGGWDAAIAAAPVTDTIKSAAPDGGVEQTLERKRLWSVQTPQVFRARALRTALERGDDELAAATDDAVLVERDGGRVRVVPAPAENLKITTGVDLALAELLLARRAR